MLKQHTSESSLNWHGLTWIGGTFESDTGGTFHSDMPGTFQSAADGTFVSAIDGTFQSDMSGTFGPLLSNKDKLDGKWKDSTSKTYLSKVFTDAMTCDLLEERDSDGEIKGWFDRIALMLH